MAINWGLNVGTTQQQGSQALNFLQQARGSRGAAAAAVAPLEQTTATPAAPAAPAVGDVPVGNAAEPTAFVAEPAAHAPAEGGGLRAAIAEAAAQPVPAARAEVAAEAGTGVPKATGWLARLRETPADQIFAALNGGREPAERAGVQGGELLARLRAGAAPVAEQVGQAAGEVADSAAHAATDAVSPVAAKLFAFGTQGATRMGSSASEIGKLGNSLLELGTRLHIKP